MGAAGEGMEGEDAFGEEREAPMIRHIATAAVYVEDQKKALDFWTETMGFEKRNERDMGNGYSWLEVAPPGAQSSLVIYPRALMTDWKERKPSIVFLCDDLERYCVVIKRRGVEFVQEPKQLPWGPLAIFRDNDGNEFMLLGI
jgi:lactoylglutathione lyase